MFTPDSAMVLAWPERLLGVQRRELEDLMKSEANKTVMLLGRLLIATIFFMNAFGVVDQARPAQEMAAHGVPLFAIAPLLWAGRITQFVGAVLLLFPDRLAAIGSFLLAAFLVPATLIAHDFWAATGDFRQAQLVGFLKNLAILGALGVVGAHFLAKPSAKRTDPEPAGTEKRNG